LSESRGCPSFKASKGEAVIIYREPLAIRRRFLSYGGTGVEDGVASTFPKGKQNKNLLNDNSSFNFTPVFHFVCDQLGFQ
jgi:hypothetical protein